MSKHHVCTILKRVSDDHQHPDELFAALADVKVIIEEARLRGSSGTPAQHTGQPGLLLPLCEHTETEIDALLRGLGTCWKMLRPLLFRVCRLSWAEPDYCKPHSGKNCRTRSGCTQSSLDADGKRQRLGQMQTQLACMESRETDALSPCGYR